MTESPYLPPIPPERSSADPPPPRDGQGVGGYEDDLQTPATIGYYNAYCVVMALIYLACLGLGIFLFWFAYEIAEDEDPFALQIQGVALGFVGAGLFLVFAIAPFLPRRKWVWIYGFFPIVIGMTSACCMPVTIPLLIFWIREDVKQYFRVRSPAMHDPYQRAQDV